MMGPLEAVMRTRTDKTLCTSLTASKYVEELKQRLEVGWKLAAKNLKEARQKHPVYFNKKAKDLISDSRGQSVTFATPG